MLERSPYINTGCRCPSVGVFTQSDIAFTDEESGEKALTIDEPELRIDFTVEKLRGSNPTNDYDVTLAFFQPDSESPLIISAIPLEYASTYVRFVMSPPPDEEGVICRWTVKVRSL